MLSRHSASASEEYSDSVSRSESVVDSEGREAISSSESGEFCGDGIMYADMEKEGFELCNGVSDIVKAKQKES